MKLAALLLALLPQQAKEAPTTAPTRVAARSAQELPPWPDVLVVILDDVGRANLDRVSAAGWTPTIDSLRASGVYFTKAHAHSWCSPSRQTLFMSYWAGVSHGDACDGPGPTSLTGAERTCWDYFRALPPRPTSYSTALFGKWHLGAIASASTWELSPLELGAQVWNAGIPSNVGTCITGAASYTRWLRVTAGTSAVSTQWADQAIEQELLAWWSSTPGPRFAVLAYQGAHPPYTAAPPPTLLPPGYPTPNPLDRFEVFESLIAVADQSLGRVLAGIGGTPWVVVVGDNGPNGCNPTSGNCNNSVALPWQDPTRLKSTTGFYGTNVPLIVSGPNLPHPGETSQAVVHVVDILPTLAEAMGPVIPVPVDGCSFLQCVLDPQNGQPTRPYVFTWNNGTGDRAVTETAPPHWKYRTVTSTGLVELFELDSDPLEQNNLAGLGLPDEPRLAAILAALP